MKKKKHTELPEAVYVGYIRSLFQDVGVLPIGAICCALIAVLLFYKTGAHIHLLTGTLVLCFGLYRYHLIASVDNSAIKDYESAQYWERRYIAWGSLHGLSGGAFVLTAMMWGADAFSELAAICAVLGGVTTVSGRNYGSRPMVFIMALTLLAPLVLGLMLKGDFYHVALGLIIVPFIFIIMKMAHLMREVLSKAINEGNRSARLAQRFDRALNTMPHGLLMLDADGRVVVANAQAAEVLSFRSPEQLQGRTLKALLARGAASGLLKPKDVHYAEKQLTSALGQGRTRKVLLRLTDGRHLEFSAREGRDELGVLTFEEVTSRVEAEEKIRYMARYDGLTGLPNRAYFQEIVGNFLEKGDPSRLCALAVLDLDDFKSINDTLGHPVGDGLIYAVAERLASFVSDDMKVGRIGGDEFIIFFNHIADEDELSFRLDTILQGIQGEVDVTGHRLRIQTSAGVVLIPASEGSVESMIVRADLALYRVKEDGKNDWRLFEAQMDAAFRNRQALKSDLRKAIDAKNLTVVFQPIIEMETMQIAACEALCRWDHAELGPVSPCEFIPLAEEMGLISEISAYVLDAACQECAGWPEYVRVSVNLSAKDFHNGAIVGSVRDALEKSGLAGHRLEIEVTETALLDDKYRTRAYLKELKKLGVTIALDDFGTGYSSLSYLHMLPLDRVKLDGSFVRDITQNVRTLRLLTSVVDLSRNLGLTVTVEGVETHSQMKLLTEKVQPDLMQGFLFGAALTGSGIATMSAKNWSLGENFKAKVDSLSL